MLYRFILSILALSFVGCRTAPPAVSMPQELTTRGQKHAIKLTPPLKTGSEITFGPYNVLHLVIAKRKPTGDTNGWINQISRGMTFSFVMASKSTPMQIPVDCAILVNEKSLALKGKREGQNAVGQAEDFLRCRVAKGATMQAADYPENGIEMKIDGLAKVGSVTISPLPYVEESENKLLAPTGYKLTLGTGTIAGLDLNADRYFYLVPHDPNQDLYLAMGAAIATIYTSLKWQISDI